MAAYIILNPSSLRYSEPGYALWNTNVATYNINRLNNTLLKLSALLDVDASGLADGNVLSYNASSSKWEPDKGPDDGRWLSTTTTTTSSTTTTTTTA